MYCGGGGGGSGDGGGEGGGNGGRGGDGDGGGAGDGASFRLHPTHPMFGLLQTLNGLFANSATKPPCQARSIEKPAQFPDRLHAPADASAHCANVVADVHL